jgi:hypothetical protein
VDIASQTKWPGHGPIWLASPFADVRFTPQTQLVAPSYSLPDWAPSSMQVHSSRGGRSLVLHKITSTEICRIPSLSLSSPPHRPSFPFRIARPPLLTHPSLPSFGALVVVVVVVRSNRVNFQKSASATPPSQQPPKHPTAICLFDPFARRSRKPSQS